MAASIRSNTMRSGLSVLILALLVWTPACVLITLAEERPVPVEVPEKFTTTGKAKVPDRWWEAFQDEDLSRLVTEALGRNLDLKVAWSRLDQAAALARQAVRKASQWARAPSSGAVSNRTLRSRTCMVSTVPTWPLFRQKP